MLPVPHKLDLADHASVRPARARVSQVIAGLGWFGAVIGLQLLFALPCTYVAFALDLKGKPWLPFAVGTTAFFLATAVLIRRASRPLGIRSTLAIRGCRPIQLILALLLLPALAPLVAMAAALARYYWDGNSTIPLAVATTPVDRMDDPYSGFASLPWSLAILLGCLAPALAEEAVFRGVVGRRMLAGLGTTVGVLITSFLFGVSHIDPARIVATFILGAAFHGAYLATRSFLVPATMHATQNLMTIFGETWASESGIDLLGRSDTGLPVPAIVFLGLCTTCAIGWTLYLCRTRWELPNGTEWQSQCGEVAPPIDLVASPRIAWPGFTPLATVVISGAILVVTSAGLPRKSLARSTAEDQARLHREHGDELRNRGDTVGAIAAYGEALALVPNDPGARGGRGLAHAARDDATAAADDLAEAVRLVPDHLDYWRYLGWAHIVLGQYEQALTDYAEVLRIEPADGYSLRQRGHAFMRLQRYREAHDEFDRAIRAAKPTKRVWTGNEGRDEVDPSELADLRALRGRALMRLGHFDQALDDFADALRLAPHHGEASYEIIWLRSASPDDRLRDGKTAVTLARQLCSGENGRTAPNLAALAAALMEGGDAIAAVRTQEEALALAGAANREFYEHALELYRAGRPYRLSATGQ
ncbi:MAG: tetratricopeptide repeat protein [Gemmataceae bacterium]